jgi:hypothetical protein
VGADAVTFDVATMLGGAVMGGVAGWYLRGIYGRARAILARARGGLNGMGE